MNALGAVRALGPIDVTSVRRDSLLRWMFAMPIVVAMLFRWGLPPISVWAIGRFGLDLAPYSPLLGSVLVMTTPMLFGTVVGFLLLDQKDDNTLTALQVTPLTAGGYLVYRLGMPSLLSIPMTIVALRLSGLPQFSIGKQLFAATGAAPLAAVFALFLAAFARNKVQGFALMKAAGAINWPPVIAWFVSSKWQWAFGLCPTYWPAKLYWELAADGSGTSIYLVLGLLFQGALIAIMLRRFDRVMHR